MHSKTHFFFLLSITNKIQTGNLVYNNVAPNANNTYTYLLDQTDRILYIVM